jgi:transcriptional regulator with GAF, ATPase, and Fis domain
MKRLMKRKVLVIIAICIALLFGGYCTAHTLANKQLHDKYAEGFQKNPLGDYTKNKSNVILAVYDAPIFQQYTNLSANHASEKVALIIWVSLYSHKKEYGITITDDAEQVTHQIEVDEHLKAETAEENALIKNNKRAIDEILSVVSDNWNIDF